MGFPQKDNLLHLGLPWELANELEKQVPGLSTYSTIDNFTATTDPGVGNDNTQSYGPGSRWLNTSNSRLWVNLSAATGAATWYLAGVVPGTGIEPSSMLTQFGAGTATFPEEGNINRQVPGVTGAVSPGATGADNVIFVYSMPANSFDASGRGVTITAAGNFAANGNTKTVKMILNPSTAVVGSTVGAGGTTIASTGAVTQNGGAWVMNASLFKRGANGSNTQVAVPGGVVLSGSHAGATAACAEVTATESGAILIAITGNAATTATDILGVFFEVNAMN